MYIVTHYGAVNGTAKRRQKLKRDVTLHTPQGMKALRTILLNKHKKAVEIDLEYIETPIKQHKY